MSVVEHRGVSAQSAIAIAGARLVIKPVIGLYPVRSWSFGPLGLIESIANRIARPSRGVRAEHIEVAGVPVERLVPASGEHRADSAICYYHGGAFLSGGPGTHRRVASGLARALGVTVYNVDYRQLPDVGVATSVDDGYRVYRAVADSGRYRHVAVGGDSAGGYVSAKVVEFAHLDDARRPSAYFGFSPLLIPTVQDGDPRYDIDDAYLTVGKLRGLRRFFDRGPEALRGEDDASAIAPAAFPPALMVACADEMLRVDVERLHARLDAAGNACELHVFEGGVHAFPVLAGATPESAAALRLTAGFLAAAFDAHRSHRAA
ncbi:Alpha/beta hydrolase fold-3 domain protein OS=Tsukamurella paurometabola (strain ATCC 8368 / DSM/ CCUG 35730 / CIP 100753 / JCM 10117 / KCTC 9821 / NBRC 16120 / NCIMB 702349 / NCTC 13040) OX=521096 GN=Tpau_1272 PE=4 SV=1 [Tsukamurella paurometabola]|uniref:Alpha/beta hydrolase fold-3 domain protein n=1 Tax=Tsukamurella paurometabola (strain ATCC 8368 / DSM 20162 / CCUG 35730 / CIP 100753 / JCM 10117 / KCTC 9821 / NBRC 16120 / NCIMB 702349 / NCTC 13040) TaxID=521096 RepID=D5UWN1_TSUPD|nr:alpha/beta hydrolase [Tsukamurella paurometabola]ADG77903.1 Alpha/beta hydrolase fold-3 domain protein [Tsukamurella paurometabola DSM 20162]SUP29278.1 Monoterpene epsilon-lactone hydrolase [Tsukamurella paurometabola]